MYTLCCYIQIAGFSTRTVHEVKVKKSIHSFVDTAVISLPTSAIITNTEGLMRESVDTAAKISQGDPVTIHLGYDGDLKEEFKGFVSRVNYTTPCQIECEGYSYLLRQKTFAKAWKDPKAKAILAELTAGSGIKLSDEIPDISLHGKMVLNTETALAGFEELKKVYGLLVYFIGDTLYYGLGQTAQQGAGQVTKYRLGWNTIKDDQLRFRKADEAKVQVKVEYRDKKGKVHTKSYGDSGGIVVTRQYGKETDMNALETKARAYAETRRFAGYDGKIIAFLIPYTAHGWAAQITDEKYPDRGGKYLVVGTEVTFGRGGGRRIVELGKTLSVK